MVIVSKEITDAIARIPINTKHLADQLRKPEVKIRFRMGVITAINSDQSINVQVGGSALALPSIKYLNSFIPVVGNSVWLVTMGLDILGIGAVATNTVVGAPTIASAGTIAPTTPRVFISGTAAIATITAPPWVNSGGSITLIPTGIFTTTIAGNIALASTAVVGKALIMTYDSGTAKWYPSY